MDNQGPTTKKKFSIKNIPRKKRGKYLVLIFFAVLILSTSATVHKFGPYRGKVVDLESGEPLEGAAVLVVFYTETFYAVSSYADAVETVTDEQGEFKIPWRLATTLHPISSWEPYGYATIFKPGYGAYPDHRKALPRFEWGGTIPEKDYVTFKLPKLKSREERRENLWGLLPTIPKRKMKKLVRLVDQEDNNLGL